MKFTKLFRAVALGIAVALASAATGMAQNIGLYSPGDISASGVLVFPAATTNTFYTYATTNGVQNGVIVTNSYGTPSITAGSNTNLLSLPVADFDYCGLTFALTGTATSTNALSIYKSFDNGNTFEATPTFSYTAIAPGAAGYLTNASLDIHGVTTLGFLVKSSGTTFGTNALLEINLKAPRSQTQQAGINNGSSPGKPNAVPNFP
jgi:hypothetical protein